MKRIVPYLLVFLMVVSCNNAPVIKPDNLIDEEKMTSILYDLTLFEAIKGQPKYDAVLKRIGSKNAIYRKHNIDSLQFVESNQYYISQIDIYRKMYDAVNERLQKEKSECDLLMKNSGNITPSNPVDSDLPQVQ
jgi:hypothetical protein